MQPSTRTKSSRPHQIMPDNSNHQDDSLCDKRTKREIELEDVLTDRMLAWQNETNLAVRIELEKPILDSAYHYLRESLRLTLAKKFGPQVLSTANSIQFTVQLNEFFLKIFNSNNSRNAILEAKTPRDARNWASAVIANQMKNCLARQTNGQKIQAEYGYMIPLIELRRAHAEERFGDLAAMLDVLEHWRNSHDTDEVQWGSLLETHYINGSTWQDTAAFLSGGDPNYYKSDKFLQLRERAVIAMRQKMELE